MKYMEMENKMKPYEFYNEYGDYNIKKFISYHTNSIELKQYNEKLHINLKKFIKTLNDLKFKIVFEVVKGRNSCADDIEFYGDYVSNNDLKEEISTVIHFKSTINNCYIIISNQPKTDYFNCIMYYHPSCAEVIKIFKFINENNVISRKKKFFMIVKNGDYLDLESLDVKDVNIDFDLYYNDDFKHKKLFDILNNKIENKKNGIILLSGVPGSGKSSLIKYAVKEVDSKFCFLPAQLIEILSNPTYLQFVITNLNNSIIVIEDCEQLLKSRERADSLKDISTILNITDGLLGDFLNIKLIVTYNTKDQIDEALLRKGRNIFKYTFNKLSVEKANKLAEKLNISKTFTEDIALCDIFNYDEDEEENNNKQKPIGFKR